MARGQVLPYSTPIFRPTTVARRRSTPPSFSSSSWSSSPSNSWDSSSYGSLISFSFISEDDEVIPYSTSTNNLRRSSFKTAGIPFSWEEIPGIPKHQDINFKKKKESSSSPPLNLLPLPPSAGKSTSTRKKLHRTSNKAHHQEDHIIISPKKHHLIDIFQRDPFFAALVECSKDDDHDHRHHNHGIVSSKITTARSLSERFGLVINMYTSCKTTCAVSESIVSLPRSAT